MPWREMDTVSKRLEFVKLASQPGSNIRELCRREQISPKTGYKWLSRYEASGGDASSLHDHSRKPLHCEQRTPAALEQSVIDLRRQHPSWGGRKIARRLADLGRGDLAPSTVTSILHRHRLIDAVASDHAGPIHRFEHERPNALWQMDFKGQFNTVAGPCYALTMLDDHSRFNLALQANARFGTAQVQPQLQAVLSAMACLRASTPTTALRGVLQVQWSTASRTWAFGSFGSESQSPIAVRCTRRPTARSSASTGPWTRRSLPANSGLTTSRSNGISIAGETSTTCSVLTTRLVYRRQYSATSPVLCASRADSRLLNIAATTSLCRCEAADRSNSGAARFCSAGHWPDCPWRCGPTRIRTAASTSTSATNAWPR
jgi:transposase-like protein